MNGTTKLTIDKNYQNLLAEIKFKLQQSQYRALTVVNTVMINFYWEVGKLILEQQKTSSWGEKLFESLSKDLSDAYPDTKGFSKTNLKYMRTFALHYETDIGQAMPDQLSWSHHVVLIQLLNKGELSKKQWYARMVIDQGWSYRKLKEEIISKLYERQANKLDKTTNFENRLAPPQSDLAREMIKDPYKFHFLTIGKEAHEREIQKGLMDHVKQFLMELGQGFALYGINYPIFVSGKRFEIDLLMYNTKLHCYVVIEIKRGDFKPEHTGQLNFYLSAIDAELKTSEDKPTIGLLLCENKDKIIAEYALNRIESPMGISEYQLAKALPEKLNKVFPTIEEIEAELNENLLIDEDPDAE